MRTKPDYVSWWILGGKGTISAPKRTLKEVMEDPENKEVIRTLRR